MLHRDLPVCGFPGERITTDAVLSLIGIRRFGGDADDFIYQKVADIFADFSSEDLSLGLAIHIPKIGQHVLVILNPVFQQGAFIIDHDDQVFRKKLRKVLGLGAGQPIYFFENIGETICVSRENLTTECQGHC